MKGKLLLLFTGLAVIFFSSSAPAQKPYRGAEYRTIGTMTYGRFEVRMRSAPVSGMLSSFFTYYDAASPWNEIDIETMGRYSNEIQFNTIVPANGNNHVQRQTVPFNPHAAFHVLGFEWTPDYVAWRIDGEEVYRQTGTHISQLVKPQKIMMNVWQPADVSWAGSFSAAQLPVYAYYDWVKYYAYTPGTGDNFTLQWTDDFNSFDVTRWQKATHTWDGNNAQFVTDNAVVANGYLILCLTSNTTSGYGGGPVVDQDVDAPSLVWARAYDSTIVVRFSETVDQLSAETISHYFGGAAAYKSAKLRPDGRTVDVSVSGMDLATPFILFVQGIKDTAASANTMSLSHVRVTMPLTFPIKIDVGGTGDANYRADSAWAETNDYGYIGGSPFAVLPSNPVSGTTEPAIYRTVVHGISGYKVRVPNGTYNVTLKMMEDRFASAGKRAFSAKVEGQTLFTNLDLFQQAGLLKAYDVVASSVVVEDNIVDIWLGAQTDSTTLAGIVIDRLAGPTGVRDQSGFPTNYEFSVFPNPFNGATVLHFALPVAGQISMLIHDTLGRVVQSMDLGMISAGVHEFRWADEKLSSGIYFFTLRGFEHQSTVRCVIMK